MSTDIPPRNLSAAIILPSGYQDVIYPETIRHQIEDLCDIRIEHTPPESLNEQAQVLQHIDLLFSGWRAPKMDEATLRLFPQLKAVFYGGGSIRNLVSEAFWEKNIPICSAWAANAIPASEYAFAQIILGLKQALPSSRLMHRRQGSAWPDAFDRGGAFGNTVGLVSLGQIACKVVERLHTLDVNVLAYDPYCSRARAEELGLQLVTLPELFSRSRVVSIHSPLLPETRGMITGDLITSMPRGATLINTARGAVIDEPAMIKVLQERGDLFAVLDVTDPEPPRPESALYSLPNVFLTPHLAGSIGQECSRMGQYMVDDCRRYLAGESLRWQITQKAMTYMA